MKQVNSADPYRRRVYAILARLLNFAHSGTEVDLVKSASTVQAMAIQLSYFAPRKSGIPSTFFTVSCSPDLAYGLA
jgi:hypothetical protein